MTPPRSGPQAAIIRFSIRFRGIVIALAFVLLGYGVYALRQAQYDVFPDFAPPQVDIQTEAPGLDPQQVEVLVTRPIETAVNGVPGLRAVRSTSLQGLSFITVVFDPESDIYRDRQVVAERLALAAGQLPQGVGPPALSPLTSSASVVLYAGLTSPTRSLIDLRTTADWTVVLRLAAVPGVAHVTVFGGEVKSLQIQVHPDRLVRFGLGFNELVAAARRATGVRGAGFIDTPNQRIVFQSEGQAATAAALAETVLASAGGVSVTLGNVADVVEAPQPRIGAATIAGRPAVILKVSEQFGANTLEVTKRVETALAELRPGLEKAGIRLYPDLFRPGAFIETATGNMGTSLLLGGLLVIAVLFVFLADFATAAISVVAIPLSLLAAVIVLQHFGISLNTMTLGGLAIAIGVVVDDAVIDIENVVRRLRENRQRAEPRPAAPVVLEACLEVRAAVVYATFAVILVVLPVLALPGIAGRLFAPLAIAYAAAVLASLLVALSVTPALLMVLLARRESKDREPPVVRWTKRGYVALLRRIQRHPRGAIAAAVLATAAGVALLPFFGGDFIPELREGHFIVHMSMVPGTSLDQTLRMGDRVSAALAGLPEVRLVAQRVGRAELQTDPHGTHQSELDVDLKPLSGDQAKAVKARIRNVLAGFAGTAFAVNTFLTERIEETISGYAAPVAVNIFANDLAILDAKAQEIARVLATVPGGAEVQIQSPLGVPQLTIRLRRADLARWGLAAVDVLDLLRAAYQGLTVGQEYEAGQAIDVVAILDPASRGDVAKVGELPLRTPDGTYILMKQIAEISETGGRYAVLHQGARRVQSVTAGVAGRDVASFVADAKARIAAQVRLPPGSYLEYAGTAEAQRRSERGLLVNGLIAAVGIVLLLSIVTRNRRNLLLALVNLPFALIGGVFAVFALGGVLSLGSMVGFVTLFGITLRNSILMLSHYAHLVAAEGVPWGPETAIRGAADRLTPILMTSLVTALGLLPLALGRDAPGREIEGPMALVILGGLLTSLVLNLLVLPTLALRYGHFAASAGPDELAEPAWTGARDRASPAE